MRPQFHAQDRSPVRAPRHACSRQAIARIAALTLLALTAAASVRAAEQPEDRSTSLQLRAEPGSLRLDGQGWVARLDLGAGDLERRSSRAGWQLLGDYYFGSVAPGNGNGLRATGGWVGLTPGLGVGNEPVPNTPGLRGPLLGTRALPLWGQVRESGTSTYLGLGYSLGLDRPGWGVKADVGLMSRRDGSGGLRLNRSGASMEDASAVGDLRWLPMLQVGVSYAF